MKKNILLFLALFILSPLLMAQAVDKGPVPSRLSAWFRTHIKQSAGIINCASDYGVVLSSETSEAHSGDTVRVKIYNTSAEHLYFAMAFIDEAEQWTAVPSDTDTRSFVIPSGLNMSVDAIIPEKVATGRGHLMVLAYLEPFDMRDVITKYTTEFLYERNVKAGAATMQLMIQ